MSFSYMHVMRCDICNFDSNGHFAPNDNSKLKDFLESGKMWLEFESGCGITQAIARGCWICRTIRDALLPFNRYLPPEWHCQHDDRDMLGGCKECSRVKEIRLNFGADPNYGIIIEIFDGILGHSREELCIIGGGIPWPGGLMPPPISRIEYLLNLLRYSKLDQARAWLGKCTLEHSGCQQSFCSPKRLLSIQDGGHNDPFVKLCSPGHSVKKYACLSYCWGRTGNLETLADNLDSQFSKIPFGDLPKTIQDAVRICLALQIYYLWVDALCIVQDDEDDWASECARMGDIYSGAHVTLAAVQGRDSEAGLLHVKPFKVARIQVRPPNGSPTEAFVYRKSQHSYPDGLLHKQHLKQRPLLTRGWVYQEFLLSPRVLRFDADELSFECREGMMCECGLPQDVSSNNDPIKTLTPFKATRLEMEWIMNSFVGNRPDPFVARRRDFSLLENGLLSHSDAFTLWYGMVEQYSSMALTKKSDRLPAFSAIASKFSRYGGRYYAGVWQNDFISGLQWFRMIHLADWALRRLNSSTGSTPSWSWTSQQDSVLYMKPTEWYRSYTAKISIENPDLSNAANIFGGVSRCYLDASSLLAPARLIANGNAKRVRAEPYTLCRYDGSIIEEVEDLGATFLSDGRLPSELETKLLSTPNSVCCFLLSKDHSGDMSHTRSLVLGLIDERQCLWRRIGFMVERNPSRSMFDVVGQEARIFIQ